MDLSITLHEPARRAELFGPGDRHLRKIREALGVRIQTRNSTLRLHGEPAAVSRAATVFERLQEMLKGREFLDDSLVEDLINETVAADRPVAEDAIAVFNREATVSAKTDGQRIYVRALAHSDLVFCLGPAGTGKTYIAVAKAVNLLKNGRCKRIALVRPAVEAGERLGFLPGDLQQKVNPYLRPIFDALHDMMTYDQLKRFMVSDIIEIVPLAYMRGRTLNNAAIILDEAQNTTPSQMLMFLTRLGRSSTMIVTGDDSQVDLEPTQTSGLTDAVSRLRGVKGIEIIRLSELDIVRHRLVQEVVSRYGTTDNRRDSENKAR